MLSIVARDPAISQSYYIQYQLCCCDCESLGSPRPCSSQSDQAADSPGETNNPVVELQVAERAARDGEVAQVRDQLQSRRLDIPGKQVSIKTIVILRQT